MAAVAPTLSLLSEVVLICCTVAAMLSTVAQSTVVAGGSTSWCVARSDASTESLQTALDYACASGADCSPLQTNGLCFLPNTIQAHASYAFNSYYQRRSMAPGSCDFSGTATVAKSDPSYGSCVYPASLSAAGGSSTTPTTPTTPTTNVPFPPSGSLTPLSNDSSSGFNNAGLSPPVGDADSSRACMELMVSKILVMLSFVVLLSFISN